jgi:hypothetical protein
MVLMLMLARLAYSCTDSPSSSATKLDGIPKVASVSGHRSCSSLKGYSHLRQTRKPNVDVSNFFRPSPGRVK